MQLLVRVRDFVVGWCAAALYTPYLLTFGIFKPRNRTLIAAIADHAGVHRPHPPRELPRVKVAEVLSTETAVIVREPEAASGNVSLVDLLAIAHIVRRRTPKRLLEIGTFDGRTTLNLAANTSPDARIVTLDLPVVQRSSTAYAVDSTDFEFIDKPVSGSRFVGTDCAAKITQVFGDSASFDFSPYFGTMDLVFIDGAHSYDYVRKDTATAMKLLAPHGAILWHDYGVRPGVTKALNEFLVEDARIRNIEGTALAILET